MCDCIFFGGFTLFSAEVLNDAIGLGKRVGRVFFVLARATHFQHIDCAIIELELKRCSFGFPGKDGDVWQRKFCSKLEGH